MKPYISRNMDGRNHGMVAASTLKEAARKLGVSVHHMRNMGWNVGSAEDARIALSDPDAIFWKPIGADSYPWSKTRYERDYDAGVNHWRVRKPAADGQQTQEK